MLYSIIFPILIVVSLAGIVVILMKKATALNMLSESEREKIEKKNILGKFVDGEKVNGKFLLLTEKLIRKIKLFFLKLENLFSTWSESIKQKRKMRENKGKFSSIRKEESKEEKGFSFERANRRAVVPKRNRNEEDLDEKIDTAFEKKNQEEKRTKKKDLFEKILIERIAANPKDVEAYERLGEYYFDIENWDHSKECFKQVLKLAPDNRNIKMKMKELERLLGR